MLSSSGTTSENLRGKPCRSRWYGSVDLPVDRIDHRLQFSGKQGGHQICQVVPVSSNGSKGFFSVLWLCGIFLSFFSLPPIHSSFVAWLCEILSSFLSHRFSLFFFSPTESQFFCRMAVHDFFSVSCWSPCQLFLVIVLRLFVFSF
jgi:hypothetical protein